MNWQLLVRCHDNRTRSFKLKLGLLAETKTFSLGQVPYSAIKNDGDQNYGWF